MLVEVEPWDEGKRLRTFSVLYSERIGICFWAGGEQVLLGSSELILHFEEQRIVSPLYESGFPAGVCRISYWDGLHWLLSGDAFKRRCGLLRGWPRSTPDGCPRRSR